jgi:hypothetical protein
MRRFFRFVVLLVVTVWAWRLLFGRDEPQERAGVSYADGSSVVLEPGMPGFERLAAVARDALRT